MKYRESMICWNPGGEIKVGAWPPRDGWARDYRMSFGACFADRHKMTKAARFATIMREFHVAVVLHGIDPQEAHREFSKIDEYREGVWS